MNKTEKEKEEISAMFPGKELDMRVARDVMGHDIIWDEIFEDMEVSKDDGGNNIYCPLRPYSQDLSFAQMIVEKMIQLGHGKAAFWRNERQPAVICRASLLEVLKKKEESNAKKRRAKLKVVP